MTHADTPDAMLGLGIMMCVGGTVTKSCPRCCVPDDPDVGPAIDFITNSIAISNEVTPTTSDIYLPEDLHCA